MKNSLRVIIAMAVLVVTGSCKKEKKEEKLALPPKSSMVIDYGAFQESKSTNGVDQSGTYFLMAYYPVTFWSISAAVVTTVPALAFEEALKNQPIWLEDKQVWEWSYTVSAGMNNYTAKLQGKVVSDSVNWEMRLSQNGNTQIADILWFNGRSHYGQTGGWWMLNHVYYSGNDLIIAPAIRINWSHKNEQDFTLRYTYVAMKHCTTPTSCQENASKGNYIEFGRKPDPKYNAYYVIYDNPGKNKYNIYWNTATTEGMIQKEGETAYCWNSNRENKASCD